MGMQMSDEHGSGGVGMPAANDTAPPTVTNGEAYEAGQAARRMWVPGPQHDANPYYHATQQWLAWRSGWNDQNVWMARGLVREKDG